MNQYLSSILSWRGIANVSVLLGQIVTLGLSSCTPTMAVDMAQTGLSQQPVSISDRTDHRYASETFGIEFTYPADYVITAEQGTLADGVIVLMRAEDVGNLEPPIIYISFSEKSQQASLETIRDDELKLWVTKEHSDTVVAGQRALDFDAQGYHESREQLFLTPDDHYAIRLSASYLWEDGNMEPLINAAKLIQDSWQWL
ncbi:MAG: hypothetical protein F6K11_10545 [Leptolyngbya sp. SIO3F4]|nr:hypothetical protein [Leptolyngbya sp. SIO3F4]